MSFFPLCAPLRGCSYVFFFQAKYDLTGHDAFVGVLEVQVSIEGEARCIFEHMSRYRSILDHIGHGTCYQARKHAVIHLLDKPQVLPDSPVP